ncbi:MAG: peptidoglycan-binding domain-containing protein [Pyrinomonadaceae bacterium]
MAYKKPVEGRSYPHVYNVAMTVGIRQGGDAWGNYEAAYYSNRRDDVMLVQYLLKRVYQRGAVADPPLDQSNGACELKVDGYYGPKTQKAITSYQFEMKKNGRSIATDGCVDPEGPQGSTSTISQTGYTISWLNKYFYLLYPELFPNIALDPECPAELKMSVGSGVY